MTSLPVDRTPAALRERLKRARANGHTVALVPTMGALHEGHLSLVRLARTRASLVVASVFVNPTQFGPGEDLAAYPRNEARDLSLLAGADCDGVYAPGVEAIYPAGFATSISVSGVSAPMEGAVRPHHFAGVATVVAKLLIQCAPDVAVFGEKDFQQLAVIRRLAADLDLSVEIIGAPTIRAEDGLALSSRNAYLTAPQRAIAPALNRALREAAGTIARGGEIGSAEAEARSALAAAGFDAVDYFDVRFADDLTRPAAGTADRPLRILAAARLGTTRLIDNVAV